MTEPSCESMLQCTNIPSPQSINASARSGLLKGGCMLSGRSAAVAVMMKKRMVKNKVRTRILFLL